MHPDLLNNSHFLRYYNLWQENPSSIVFAPIAAYLLGFGMVKEAVQVCLEGLKHHPRLVSGRLILAKCYLKQKKWMEAGREIQAVFQMVPDHEKARELLEDLETAVRPQAAPALPPVLSPAPRKSAGWETLTMAKIFAAQGHVDRAAQVYQTILSREPHNEEAKRGLSELEAGHR